MASTKRQIAILLSVLNLVLALNGHIAAGTPVSPVESDESVTQSPFIRDDVEKVHLETQEGTQINLHGSMNTVSGRQGMSISTGNNSPTIYVRATFDEVQPQELIIWVSDKDHTTYHIKELVIENQDGEIVHTTSGDLGEFVNVQITLKKGVPYTLIARTESGHTVKNVVYASDDVLENLPKDVFLGGEYMTEYNSYLSVIQESHEILVDICRGGQEIPYGGVTVNRVPWRKAWANPDEGYFLYGTSQSLHEAIIKNRVYLPKGSASYEDPELGNKTIDTELMWHTRFHELAHVLCKPRPRYLEEDFANFFGTQLFALLDANYSKSYRTSVRQTYGSYDDHVTNKSIVGNHLTQGSGFPSTTIGEYVLLDFYGVDEIEADLRNRGSISPDQVGDYGTEFIKQYFAVVNHDTPDLDDNTTLVYAFSQATGENQSDAFRKWGLEFDSNSVMQEATDPDGDGKFEDIDGDGEFTIVDVQKLFKERDSYAIQNSPDKYDFNGDGQVSIADIQRLFTMLLAK